jgi:polygalacturonase
MSTDYNSCSTGGSPSLSDIVVNGIYSTQSISGAYTSINGRNASYPVNAVLAHVDLDSVVQSGDQYANIGIDDSNDTPSGIGVTASDVSLSGSVPQCSF